MQLVSPTTEAIPVLRAEQGRSNASRPKKHILVQKQPTKINDGVTQLNRSSSCTTSKRTWSKISYAPFCFHTLYHLAKQIQKRNNPIDWKRERKKTTVQNSVIQNQQQQQNNVQKQLTKKSTNSHGKHNGTPPCIECQHKTRQTKMKIIKPNEGSRDMNRTKR